MNENFTNDSISNSNIETKKEIIIMLYKETMEQTRHIESLRSKMTSIILVIYSALATALGVLSKDSNNLLSIYITTTLLIIELISILFTFKMFERYSYYLERARTLREYLNDYFQENELSNLIELSRYQLKTEKEKKRIKNQKKTIDLINLSKKINKKEPDDYSKFTLKIFSLIRKKRHHYLWILLHTILFIATLLFFINITTAATKNDSRRGGCSIRPLKYSKGFAIRISTFA